MPAEAKSILLVDDDERFRLLCEEVASDIGLEALGASDGIEALEKIKSHEFSLAIVDLKMPRMGGLDLLYHTREISPSLPIIIITGHGSIESAVEAMKLGAVDYIAKPCSVKEIRDTIIKILEWWQVTWRDLPKKESMGKYGIIGRSKAMKIVYERIQAMCHSENTVLIMGESGVGKELVAKAIHYYGDRANEPFIPIDCSVLSLNIVESELFGHFKGAFTDAHHTRVGLLKLAGKGTVFLDEITEIPLEVQAKLLRAIQEREIRPVGSSKMAKIEARIIAATNQPLKKAVREGNFREDLFYRLHVIPVPVPPLREHPEDIPLLVDHFIQKYNTERRSVHGISPEALEILHKYSWSGNIRELENVIQQTIALGTSDIIRPIDIPAYVQYPRQVHDTDTEEIKSLRNIEKDAIIKALRMTSGRKQDGARLLGIGKTTLYEKLKKYNINEPDVK